MSDSQKLIIRIEIEAPLGCDVRVNNNDSITRPGRRLISGPGTTHPSAGTAFAQVDSSSSTSGTICVRGTSDGAGHDIYVALDSTTKPTSRFATSDSQGNWGGELGGVSCGPYSTPVAHALTVWRDFGGSSESETINFQAICAPYTSCNQTQEPVGIPIAWPVFRVIATNFSGDKKSAFNGEHLVKLSQGLSNDSVLVWVSEASCSQSPQVTLTLHRLGTPRWELRFIQGDSSASYSKLQSNWNAIGANILNRDCCCKESAATVEIHPAS